MSFTAQRGRWPHPGGAMPRANANRQFRFPFQTFAGAADFHGFMAANRAVIDMRYAYETALAARAQPPALITTGSCGLCLRATEFVSALPDREEGKAAPPNWREQQICGCADGLNARFRALLQFIHGEIGLFPWMRVLLLGAAQCIEPRLRPMVASLRAQSRAGQGWAWRAGSQPYHVLISSEYVPAAFFLDDMLTAWRAALLPGGQLVFTAPFDTAAAVSVARDGGWILGWDILDLLADAGFGAASAHLFWSEEFGYLGPFNMIFSAASV